MRNIMILRNVVSVCQSVIDRLLFKMTDDIVFFMPSFKLPQTMLKKHESFAQTYLITQNWMHFRQYHWLMDVADLFGATLFGSIKT